MTSSSPSQVVRPATVPRDRNAVVGLDLIRFAAALCVVFYHYAFFSWHGPISSTGLRAAIGTSVSFPRLVPASWWGWVGVQVFFAISGLVICISAERQSASAFLRSRFLRLAPALWVFATLSLIVTMLYSSEPIGTLLAYYFRSVALFPKGPWIDGVYWTLTIEVAFYAATFMLIAAGRFGRVRGIATVASLTILGFYLLVLVARIWPEARFADPVLALAGAYVSRIVLLTTGAYFLVGVSIYLLDRDGWTLPSAVILCSSLIAGSVGIWLSAETLPAVTEYGCSPATPVAIWLGAVGLLVLSMRWHRVSVGSARLRSTARSIGLATYPLYLFHNIAGAFVFGILLEIGIGDASAMTIAIVLGVVVSFGFALWIEPPCRRALARCIDRPREGYPSAVYPPNSKGRDRT